MKIVISVPRLRLNLRIQDFRQRIPIEPPDLRPWIPTQTSNLLPSPLTVSCSGRELEYSGRVESNLKMVVGSLCRPKDDDDSENPLGDDAHFVCLEFQTIGVADGVGGWSKKGIDAGQYAREIMNNAKIAVQSEPKGGVNPKRVMQLAFSNTRAQGSSTACIITLSGDVLRAANVGDSGFMVIRDWKVVYRSPVQQRCFNCPYQLGNSRDDPSLAQELEVKVEAGDIVIAGTDGLFDNIHESEIEEVVKKRTIGGAQPKELSCAIATLALYNSFDRFADSPFARASRKAGKNHRGGKEDDITVIVAFIQTSIMHLGNTYFN